MHRILLITAIVFCSYGALGQSNDHRITINRSAGYKVNQLLEIAIAQNINIVYSPTRLPGDVIAFEKGTYPISDILDKYKSMDLTYTITSNAIVIQWSPKKRILLSGYVKDTKSGESLIGATININNGELGTVTNNYGFFSLPTAKEESVVITIRFVGFRTLVDTLNLVQKNPISVYELEESMTELQEIVVSNLELNRNITSMIPGEKILDNSIENQIPYFLGEVDVIQKSLTLPGIRTLGEDAAGLNVRGGNIDQNLLLLDEAIIYNPNHFYGLISVFNPDAVNSSKIMKGFIPAKYGGRASSVISIHQKEGNKYNHVLTGGIGLVSARLMLEGPIKRGESSYLVSARQSLFDISDNPFSDAIDNSSRTSFQDFNLKINWVKNEKNNFFLSGYYGNDQNRAGFDAIRRWGNRTGSFRWNHTYNRRHFANYSFVVSDFSYRIINPLEAGSFIGRSDIRDYSLKLNHEYTRPKGDEFEFGLEVIFHRLQPGERLPFDENSSLVNEVILDNEHGLEIGAYGNHNLKIGDRASLLYGLRISSLATFGPANTYIYNRDQPRSTDGIIDTLVRDQLEVIDHFINPEPRLSLNINLEKNNSLKIGYGRVNQYLQLISNTATPAPTDIWKLSTRYIDPVKVDHISLGYYQNFSTDWEGYIEGYYKSLRNVIDYKDGADLLLNETLETELVSGFGRAYGLEFYLEKRSGPLHGWLSYTLSRSERRFSSRFTSEEINRGKFFPDNQDKTHDLSAVLIHPRSEYLSFSASFNYSTGRPITFPLGKYEIDGLIVPYFEGRNQNRISDYHRLDLAARWEPKTPKLHDKLGLEHYYWTFTLYNVYARRNAYSYFFRQSESDPNTTEVVRYSIFGFIIPAITLNFQF